MMTEEEKDQLIARALASDEGKVELGKRILEVNPLLQGSLPDMEWESYLCYWLTDDGYKGAL